MLVRCGAVEYCKGGLLLAASFEQIATLRSLARGHTELCIKVLAGIVSQEANSPAARVSAAGSTQR
jgi:hypothetical protein